MLLSSEHHGNLTHHHACILWRASLWYSCCLPSHMGFPKGEVSDQQRHLLLQHLRSAMMPMPCGLCSPQVHRQCAHEQDVHTCCSLSIVHAFILPVWIVQQHPSLPRILLPNLKFNMPNCSIYIMQLSITTLLSSARTLSMWVRFSQQLLQSSSSSTFITSSIYLISTLSGRSKATKQIPLAGGAHGCKSWEQNQTPATQWTLLPWRLQRQKPCVTEFFLVNCLLDGGSLRVCPKPLQPWIYYSLLEEDLCRFWSNPPS